MIIQPTLDIDEIVANNIQRLRGNQSRAALAKRLNELTGHGWTDHRILDLEGKRKPRPPSPARWTELVDLSIAFGVPIFELVIPHNHKHEVALGIPNKEADGDRLGIVHSVTTTEFVAMLFDPHHRAAAIDKQREALTWEIADLITKIEELNKTEDNT